MSAESEEEKMLRLAFSEALRAIADQSETHSSVVASRAAVVGAINALVATVFASHALADRPDDGDALLFGLSALELLALSCLLGSIIFLVLALRPRTGWRVYLSPTILIQDYVDSGAGYEMRHMYRYLAEILERNRESNERFLSEIMGSLHMALMLGVAQIIFWLIDLRM